MIKPGKVLVDGLVFEKEMDLGFDLQAASRRPQLRNAVVDMLDKQAAVSQRPFEGGDELQMLRLGRKAVGNHGLHLAQGGLDSLQLCRKKLKLQLGVCTL